MPADKVQEMLCEDPSVHLENMVHMNHLSEPSMLHNIRVRYTKDIIYVCTCVSVHVCMCVSRHYICTYICVCLVARAGMHVYVCQHLCKCVYVYALCVRACVLSLTVWWICVCA